MVCGDGAKGNIKMMLMEVHRVLKPNGVHLIFSRQVEQKRKPVYLKDMKVYNWRVSKHMV